MTRTTSLITFLVWGLASPGAVRADELLERPETLRGPTASWEGVFAGAGSPRVDLRYEASELLSSQSVLTVEVDGVPRITRPLRPLGRMVVPLGELDEGFHRLSIRSRVQVADDPCLERHADDAWIRLDSAHLRGVDPPEAGDTLLDWFAERLGDDVWVDVPESVREELDPDWASAILDAHGLAWQRGLAPSPTAETRIALRIGRAEHGVAHVEEDRRGLVVTAGGPLPLAAGLRAMRADGVLRRCPTRGCELSALDVADEAPPEPSGDRVVRLDELGFARGWRAQGEGRHVLRFGWDRPADWRPTEWPRVEIAARIPDAGIDHERSRATLAINDVPLASWELARGEARWRGRVPRAVWNDGRWDVTLVVTLRSSDDEGCHDEDDDLWVHVDGASALHVPREELTFRGLASAADHFRGAPLVWSEHLDADGLGALASVLSPLATPDGWTWLPPRRRCRSACIHLATGRWWESGSRLALVGRAGGRRWRDDSGELGIPLLPAEDTLLLERVGEDSLRVTVLGVPEELTSPRWVGLLGELALFHDGTWDILAVEDDPVVTRRVSGAEDLEPAREPLERTRVRWVDIVFSLLGCLILAAVALGSWRRRRESRHDGVASERGGG